MTAHDQVTIGPQLRDQRPEHEPEGGPRAVSEFEAHLPPLRLAARQLPHGLSLFSFGQLRNIARLQLKFIVFVISLVIFVFGLGKKITLLQNAERGDARLRWPVARPAG